MITADEIMKEIDHALKQFGEYTYIDKGADEVMDVTKISNELKKMRVSEIIEVLKEVEEKHRMPEAFLSAIVMSLDGWEDPKADELFQTELFNKYY